MNDDPFAPLADARAHANAERALWMTVLPVPAVAPNAPASHPRLGKPEATWPYRGPQGELLGFVYRFATPDGKDFRPLTFARPAGGGKARWQWQSWQPKRPLYGLERLAERPDAPVVVTEGEKAADAAGKLCSEMVAVTSPNGSKSADKADWSTLRDREIVIWPDADAAGLAYAKAVAAAVTAAGATRVSVVAPPRDCKAGWDAADALNEGWDRARAKEFIRDAAPAPGQRAAPAEEDNPRRVAQRDIVLGLVRDCEFWRDAGRGACVTFPLGRHREHWSVKSEIFRMWLARRFYERRGEVLGGQGLEDVLRHLEARAAFDGPEYKTFVRVGEAEGKIYLDLADDAWRAVEISGDGWRVVPNPPVKLTRSPSMRPLLQPEQGGMIEELRGFINLSEDHYMLTVAWLVAALRPKGPYPILVANGEQGSGKSIFSRMVRSLVDPSAAPVRSMPNSDRDLMISASNSHVLAFDNLSSVPGWLADALSRLCTGGGFATRTLHTDREETILEGQRPIILNGIPHLTERADLADRALTVHLKSILENERLPEDEFWTKFERARPRIMGGLLDALSAALRHLPDVISDGLGRMADFEKLIIAAEPGLGWDRGAFQRACRENRREVSESSFNADPVAVAIGDLVTEKRPEGWTGTPTELLAALNDRARENTRRSKLWPATPQALGNRFDRITPLLRLKGFVVDRRHSSQRTIIIAPPKG